MRTPRPSAGDVAVVTGAGRGFGLAIAQRLHARGMHVVLADVQGAEAAAASLGPARATGVTADVREAAAHERLAAVAREHGRLTAWVNNAGVAMAGKAFEHPDEAVERTVAVNLLGVVHGSRAAVAAMRGTGGGHILNLGSMSSHGPVPGLAVYAATKAGVLSFSGGLQGDLDIAGIPIRVHCLCPDAAATRMVEELSASPDSAILFSTPALLGQDAVADAAVALLDGRRIVRSLPGWRAASARVAGAMPRVGLPVLRGFRAIGERRRPAA